MKFQIVVLAAIAVCFIAGIVIHIFDLADGRIDFYPITVIGNLFIQIGQGFWPHIQIHAPSNAK